MVLCYTTIVNMDHTLLVFGYLQRCLKIEVVYKFNQMKQHLSMRGLRFNDYIWRGSVVTVRHSSTSTTSTHVEILFATNGNVAGWAARACCM